MSKLDKLISFGHDMLRVFGFGILWAGAQHLTNEMSKTISLFIHVEGNGILVFLIAMYVLCSVVGTILLRLAKAAGRVINNG